MLNIVVKELKMELLECVCVSTCDMSGTACYYVSNVVNVVQHVNNVVNGKAECLVY